MLDAARVEEEAASSPCPTTRPPARIDRSGTPVTSAVRAGVHCRQYSATCSKPTVCVVDELVIDPAVLDHQVQHAGEERRVAAGLDRKEQIARARDRRDARVLHDDLRALLARLPDVVGRDRRALGDVRAGDPDHLRADHVGPRVGRAVDAERLLVRRAGADHAEPAVVVDVRRLQADARELAEQVGLLGREARAAEHADDAGAVRLLDAVDLRRDAARSPRRRASALKPRGARRVAPSAVEQPIGMAALQVALDALRAEHAAVERELLPRLEADDLVVP